MLIVESHAIVHSFLCSNTPCMMSNSGQFIETTRLNVIHATYLGHCNRCPDGRRHLHNTASTITGENVLINRSKPASESSPKKTLILIKSEATAAARLIVLMHRLIDNPVVFVSTGTYMIYPTLICEPLQTKVII